MSELNEELLVEKAKTDQASFSQLYEMYLPKIFAYVTRRIGNRDEAEDLTSNIFVRVLENMKKFDPKKSSFKTWIYTIATRMMIDYFRTHKKKRTESIEMAETISDPQKNPHEQAQENQQRQKVLSVIDQLSDRHQRILMLKYFSGLETPELALALGVTENNASVIVHRALKDFQTTYQRYV
ncbi:sigma-70 family RNA polymerase sigma factor [Candidatus Peregrinibacteria bacterium]|nr:sigma-70 family RNA polymerase sigma factor [Candidatus Peregrinibacteria bacterium]